MKILERVLAVVGLCVLGAMLWKLDASVVWAHAAAIGWGLPLIFAQQLVDHILNAWGWLFALHKEDAAKLEFRRLVAARVVGDGVNYLTPSATVAGEVIRPAMLDPSLPSDVRIASVIVARFTQSLGQALFIMIGLVFVVRHWSDEGMPAVAFIRDWFFIPMTALLLTLSAMTFYSIRAWKGRGLNARPSAAPAESSWLGVRAEIAGYFARNPGRFLVSTAFFTVGYAWGAVEIYLICLFMGVPATLALALSIEVLSSVIDGVFFMIPAKLGTQEAGKTAIFTGFGLPAAQGFALGLIRHVREIGWASLGLALYAWDRKTRARTVAAGD